MKKKTITMLIVVLTLITLLIPTFAFAGYNPSIPPDIGSWSGQSIGNEWNATVSRQKKYQNRDWVVNVKRGSAAPFSIDGYINTSNAKPSSGVSGKYLYFRMVGAESGKVRSSYYRIYDGTRPNTLAFYSNFVPTGGFKLRIHNSTSTTLYCKGSYCPDSDIPK